MGRLIDADAFRNKLVEMTNDPFASTNRPLNWSHAYESVMVELDRMPNAQGWISVQDRLPPNPGKNILVVNGHGVIRMYAFWKKNDGRWTWINQEGRFVHVNDITHWMPIPEPPKEDKG